jgi:protein SCO1/2
MRWLLLCALTLCFCQKQKTEDPAVAKVAEHAAVLDVKGGHGEAKKAALGGESLYQLQFALTDQDGKTVTLDSLRGQLVIVSMFYAHCPNACPMLFHKTKTLEQKLSDAERKQVRVFLVSLAPDVDTDSVLKGLAKKLEVDETRWRFARTDEKNVRELAAVLGINYRKLDDGNYNHSSVLTLLDRSGVAVAKMEGLAEPVEPLLERIRTELARPSQK